MPYTPKPGDRVLVEPRRSFTVTLDIPANVTIPQMREYIRDAIGTYCKSFEPPLFGSTGDPLFHIDSDTITVKSVPLKAR